MKIEQFNELVEQASLRKIEKSLKANGFINCKLNRRLRHASLYDIAMAPYEKTPHFPDGRGNEYNGNLIHDVKGFEQYEFIMVQLLASYKRGCESLSTKGMLIYAKEATK